VQHDGFEEESEMLVSMFLRQFASATPDADRRTECERWFADPLSHPDLQRMDSRQLGDLPIGGVSRRADDACRSERC
jgi:hypothetical protein